MTVWQEPKSINEFPPGCLVILNPKLGWQFMGKKLTVNAHSGDHLELQHEMLGTLTIHYTQVNRCNQSN